MLNPSTKDEEDLKVKVVFTFVFGQLKAYIAVFVAYIERNELGFVSVGLSLRGITSNRRILFNPVAIFERLE